MLRAARPGDEAGILACIQALADYEREPDAVENTVGMLHDALFGDDPRVFAHVVAREDADRAAGDGSSPDEIVGIAIWFLTYSTWTGRHGIWLEDLYVRDSERGSGFGLALIASLAAVCTERGYSRLEWTVLDWNEPSIAFYRAIGAQPQSEWTSQRMSGDALAALAARI